MTRRQPPAPPRSRGRTRITLLAGLAGLVTTIAARRPTIPTVPWRARSDVVAPTVTASLIGRVLTASGRPLAAVQLRLVPVGGDASNARSARTDSSGSFAWTGLSAGQYTITARRVGYTPVSTTFDLAEGVNTPVIIRMTALAQLDTIVTTTQRLTPARYGPSSRMDEFYESMHRGLGKFFPREKLDSLPATSAADVVTGVPGMAVHWAFVPGIGNAVIIGSSGCRGFVAAGDLGVDHRTGIDTVRPWGNVALVIDGVQIPSREEPVVFNQLHTSDIEAMAVYHDLAELPPEVAGSDACAAVYVWTRFGTGSGSTRRRP